MGYILTRHAADVVEARNIKQQWLDRVIEAPEKVESEMEDGDLEHRLGRIAENGNRVLRAVLNIRSKPEQVVTAYFDRSMRSKL